MSRVEAVGHGRRLDIHEHGMWDYPEFSTPVPGGCGTESHAHLGTHSHAPAGIASSVPASALEVSALPSPSEG